jgi:hypothetical protein
LDTLAVIDVCGLLIQRRFVISMKEKFEKPEIITEVLEAEVLIAVGSQSVPPPASPFV